MVLCGNSDFKLSFSGEKGNNEGEKTENYKNPT
jgi:hypothetical protein